jgi:glycosyltransferase involved in cell wall biosynthesis
LTATRTIRVLSVQPVAERGGSDHALLRLVRSLPRDEFEFHIALPGPSPLADEFAAAGATLHVVPMERLSTSHGAATWGRYVAGWPLAVWRLRTLVRTLDVDVVHTNSLHSLYGWAAARLTQRPHVWHAREVVVQSGAALRLERFLCRHFATRVVAVSYAVAAQLDPANVVVLDEHLDAAEFAPRNAGEFRARVGVTDDAMLVGAIGRLDPLKGFDVLLDAFARVRASSARDTPGERPGDAGPRLVIVGAPVLGQESYGAGFARRCAGAEGVLLLMSRDDIPAVVADLDVLALPSIEPESYGLVLVEALASGVPVVTTDHGGPPEIAVRAEPGSARLVPPGDAGALADAITALLPPRTSTAARRRRTRKLTLPPPRFADVFRSVL